ncbi:LPXTG cell wall anchor domain-containing protein [Luteimicrobium sp. NPDC057192]|uniref:LPXTG cell wall anchor domain-containing protein n=1 Tax=Luteimicrobium sp. NPDC057192 TaxID=3346042 RepID=UPI003624AE10
MITTAAALTLLPAAAFAADDYGAGDFSDTCPVSDATPVVGQTVTCTLHGPANTDVTATVTSVDPAIPSSAITIAGTKAITKTTDASGAVTFDLTFAEPGTYTFELTATDGGAEISTQQLVVSAAAAGAGNAAAPGTGSLATTGADVLPYALGAAGLVLVGAGTLVVVRRRRA